MIKVAQFYARRILWCCKAYPCIQQTPYWTPHQLVNISIIYPSTQFAEHIVNYLLIVMASRSKSIKHCPRLISPVIMSNPWRISPVIMSNPGLTIPVIMSSSKLIASVIMSSPGLITSSFLQRQPFFCRDSVISVVKYFRSQFKFNLIMLKFGWGSNCIKV